VEFRKSLPKLTLAKLQINLIGAFFVKSGQSPNKLRDFTAKTSCQKGHKQEEQERKKGAREPLWSWFSIVSLGQGRGRRPPFLNGLRIQFKVIVFSGATANHMAGGFCKFLCDRTAYGMPWC